MRTPGAVRWLSLAALAAISSAPGAAAEEALGPAFTVAQTIETPAQRNIALDRQTRELARTIDSIRAESIATAAAVQAREMEIAAAASELAALDARYRARSAAHDADRARLGDLLAGLALVARSPPNALIGRPAEWADTVRGVILLEHIAPILKERADAAAAEAAELDDLRIARTRRQAELNATRTALAREQTRLRLLLERYSSLQASLMAERRALAKARAERASAAPDVRNLIDRLDAERDPDDPPPHLAALPPTPSRRAVGATSERDPIYRDDAGSPAAATTTASSEPDDPPARLAALTPVPPRRTVEAPGVHDPNDRREAAERAPGHAAAGVQPAALTRTRAPPGSSLPYPAHGEVTAAFGEDSGERGQGISIATPAGAQVVAPGDGDIVFAGPFRSYGQLLIIEHDDGYVSVMAGFARIDGQVGQSVLAGEPVGVMAADAASPTVLYVEIRRDDAPVDPVSWLLSDKRRVSG